MAVGSDAPDRQRGKPRLRRRVRHRRGGTASNDSDLAPRVYLPLVIK
jgi:hypothetical protein